MMKEIQGVASEPNARRRWFHDDYFDLFVWQAPTGEVTSFQLCYGLSSSEQALVWERDAGFYHDGPRGRVPTGRNAGKAVDPMLARFDVAAGELPPELRKTLMERMREYVRSKPEVPSRRQRFRRADWQKLEPQQ
jgi:hypothetical protein